jgi:hypothetical protein
MAVTIWFSENVSSSWLNGLKIKRCSILNLPKFEEPNTAPHKHFNLYQNYPLGVFKSKCGSPEADLITFFNCFTNEEAYSGFD